MWFAVFPWKMQGYIFYWYKAGVFSHFFFIFYYMVVTGCAMLAWAERENVER